VPRRILLLITDLKIGGTPTVVRELALRLGRSDGFAVHVACLDGRGAVADQLLERGVAVTALDARCDADAGAVLRLIRLIRRQRFDTVLSFLVHANAAAALAAPFCPGVRLIESIQTTQPHPRWHWAVQRLAQHAAQRIVAPSPSAAAAARRWAGVPQSKLVVIPNAVEPSPRSLPEFREGGKTVVFLGRLDPIKRVGDLVMAMPMLESDVTLHVFGEGVDRRAIEESIRDLNLEKRVTLHGEVDGPREALAMADVLVLPSLAEGFGLVLIEAMAAGVPVVATDVPGIRDVVSDGVNGLLVPPKSPQALAGAIGRVLSDRALRQMLVGNGSRIVRERFTWQPVLPMYRSLLERG